MRLALLPFILIIALGPLTSCSYTEKPRGDFLSMLSRSDTVSVDKLNFSGGYHRMREDNYHHPIRYERGLPTAYVDTPYLDQPLFFFRNGKVLYNEATWLDTNNIEDWAKHAPGKWGIDNWGVYEIRQDTIKAIIYLGFRPAQLRQSYFEGLQKNRDTILQWHMVPPYPKIRTMDEDFLEHLKTPKDIFFKPVPAKRLLDSSKAWINGLHKK